MTSPSATPSTEPGTPARIARTSKRAEDTAAGCRAKAAADLDRAAAPDADCMRGRLEHSAAAWTARADLLERLDRKFEARMDAVAQVRGH